MTPRLAVVSFARDCRKPGTGVHHHNGSQAHDICVHPEPRLIFHSPVQRINSYATLALDALRNARGLRVHQKRWFATSHSARFAPSIERASGKGT